MNTRVLIAAAAVLLLAACDRINEQINAAAAINTITIEIPPGFLIDIDGKAVAVFGYDQCSKPDAVMTTLFGPSTLSDSKNCISIKPDAKTVKAGLAIDHNLVSEIWTVERSGTAFGLRRPSGKPVVRYDDSARSVGIKTVANSDGTVMYQRCKANGWCISSVNLEDVQRD